MRRDRRAKREGPDLAVRVLVVDDHALVRRGVVDVLRDEPGFAVVGEADDGAEAVSRASELRPDVILMDLYMPRLSGLEATRQIKAARPETRIVVLTVSEEEHDLFEAVKAGAEGYLLKNVNPGALRATLRGVARGEAYVTPLMASKILHEFTRQSQRASERSPGATLTAREREVLQLLTRGAVNKEIASALSISVNTVKVHLRHIMERLHLENRVQVVSYALREGLVEASREPPAPDRHARPSC